MYNPKKFKKIKSIFGLYDLISSTIQPLGQKK